MMDFFKKLFGGGAKVDYKAMYENGAQIIDVRSPSEYRVGHIKNSVNIPLQSLPNSLSGIKKDKPVIVCCASGMRSASAKGILKSNGFTDVHNGGDWTSLQSKIW